MKCTALLTGLLLALCATLAPAQVADEYAWLSNLDDAEQLAREEGKPLLAVFR